MFTLGLELYLLRFLGCRALRFPIWEPGSQFWEPGSQNPIFGSQTARKTSKNLEKLRIILKGDIKWLCEPGPAHQIYHSGYASIFGDPL